MKFTDAAPLNDLAQLQQGWTALHHAAEKDPDGRMVERMLLAGCSPHVANDAGQTRGRRPWPWRRRWAGGATLSRCLR